jgi:glutathione S-transferase
LRGEEWFPILAKVIQRGEIPMPSRLKIYGVPFSVHTRKVIVAARMKSIPYEVLRVVPVVPETLPPGWRAISPTGFIPAIDDEGFILADSTAIVLYLERKHPGPSLLPRDMKDYGAALSLDAWAGGALFRGMVQPLFHNQIVAPNIRKVEGDRAAIEGALHRSLPEAYGYLEGRLQGTYLVGDALSLADVAVVSNLVVMHYLGHRIDRERFPKVAGYFQQHRTSPLIAAVIEDEKPSVEGVPGLQF